MFTRNPIPSATMGAKFQQHSSGRFTAEPSAPINRHHPATTSLKYTLCLQRKQSGTSYKTSHCVVSVCWTHVTYEANQLHVAETWSARRAWIALSLTERSPVSHQCGAAPPNHIIHRTSPPNFPCPTCVGSPNIRGTGEWPWPIAKTSTVNGWSSFWNVEWRVFMGTNQKAATFELNKPCQPGIWTGLSHWVNYRKDCTELC